MTEEITRAVVRRHLGAWQRGDIPALLDDYADDAVMLSGEVGAVVGKEAIGAMYAQVFTTIFRPEETRLNLTSEIISGDHALVHWTAESSVVRATGGFDTFTLRDGKIVAQAGGAQMVPLG